MTNDVDSSAESRWTRRAVLGMVAAVPALVASALAGPVAAAEAKRRGAPGSGSYLSLFPVAQQLASGPSGPAVQFRANVFDTTDALDVQWMITAFSVNGVPLIGSLSPTFFIAENGANTVRLTVAGLNLTGKVTVELSYRRGSDPIVTIPTTVVMIRPTQAFAGGRPPRTPRRG